MNAAAVVYAVVLVIVVTWAVVRLVT